jgi:hypothetical protein
MVAENLMFTLSLFGVLSSRELLETTTQPRSLHGHDLLATLAEGGSQDGPIRARSTGPYAILKKKGWCDQAGKRETADRHGACTS